MVQLPHRLLFGGLPPFFMAEELPEAAFEEWFVSYWAKDVQELFHIEKRRSFIKLAQMIMAQSGSIFEASKFASTCELSPNSVRNYLAILEETYVVYIVRPFSTRAQSEIVKAPRVYGFDTGFVCYARGWIDLRPEDRFWNPYFAGLMLGLVLLMSFLIMGKGLGASGAANRLGIAALSAVAPDYAASNQFVAETRAGGRTILDNYFVFEVLGAFLGGIVSAYAAGRLRPQVTKGPRVSVKHRLMFALAGGVLMGFAARLARGCTSGQALSGGALLSVGSWVFMFAVFGGGYALAYSMRRQWT